VYVHIYISIVHTYTHLLYNCGAYGEIRKENTCTMAQMQLEREDLANMMPFASCSCFAKKRNIKQNSI